MIGKEHLLALARTYAEAEGVALATASTRIFKDGKVLTRIDTGGDITTDRFREAIQWLSEHWPDGAEWPVDVPRPETAEA